MKYCSQGWGNDRKEIMINVRPPMGTCIRCLTGEKKSIAFSSSEKWGSGRGEAPAV